MEIEAILPDSLGRPTSKPPLSDKELVLDWLSSMPARWADLDAQRDPVWQVLSSSFKTYTNSPRANCCKHYQKRNQQNTFLRHYMIKYEWSFFFQVRKSLYSDHGKNSWKSIFSEETKSVLILPLENIKLASQNHSLKRPPVFEPEGEQQGSSQRL